MCHILLIEDHADVRELLADSLIDEGHEVAEAADGVDALEQLKAYTPCLILLDLAMPRMDGWEFLAAIRRDPTLARIPIIVASARVRRNEPPPVLAAKAYWPKPVDAEHLAGIGRYCDLHRSTAP